jgi:hypothetical protein
MARTALIAAYERDRCRPLTDRRRLPTIRELVLFRVSGFHPKQT